MSGAVSVYPQHHHRARRAVGRSAFISHCKFIELPAFIPDDGNHESAEQYFVAVWKNCKRKPRLQGLVGWFLSEGHNNLNRRRILLPAAFERNGSANRRIIGNRTKPGGLRLEAVVCRPDMLGNVFR
jgi:hypothetical protein